MRTNAKKYVEVTCAATGEKFLKEKKEYDRQVRLGNTRFFKNRIISNAFIADERASRRKIVKRCPCCGGSFESTSHKKSAIYCSRVCASRHSSALLSQDAERSRRKSVKVSEASRASWASGERSGQKLVSEAERTRSCAVCGKSFVAMYRTANKKTCSKECHNVLRSNIARENPNFGGECYPRKRLYKDISMDSSWEVELAIWLDARLIRWERGRKLVLWWTDDAGQKRRYHPDFYLPEYNVYLEPKNKTLMERDAVKIRRVLEENQVTIFIGKPSDIIEELQKLRASSGQSGCQLGTISDSSTNFMNEQLQLRLNVLDAYITEMKRVNSREEQEFVWEEGFEPPNSLNRVLQLNHVRAAGMEVKANGQGFKMRLKQ